MANLVKKALSGLAGIGAYCATHYSPLELTIADSIREINNLPKVIETITDYPMTVSGIIGLSAVALGMIFIPSKKTEKIYKTNIKEEHKKEKTLYDTLNNAIKDYTKTVKTRSITDDTNSLYGRRSTDEIFLDKIVNNVLDDPTTSHFKSEINKENIVKESMELLQKTLYNDFIEYQKIKRILIDEKNGEYKKNLTWKDFNETIAMIGSFADSIRTCFKFYIKMCENNPELFRELGKGGYRVLPDVKINGKTNIAKYQDEDLFHISTNKLFGENFESSHMLKIMSFMKNDKVKMKNFDHNPTLYEAFIFLDNCVEDLIEPINILLGSKKYFEPYKFTKTIPYQRISWLKENIGRINSEGASYHYTQLVSAKKSYDEGLEKLKLEGFSLPREAIIEPKEIDALKEQLKQIQRKNGGSTQIVYKTEYIKAQHDTQRISAKDITKYFGKKQ